MEQLTATVKQNADNAHHASKLAEDASGKASRGGQMVSGVVKTMGNISTSSKKISEITAVINSIAFQTNILALNAAVEAARAGDHGKGFSVVAGEVRSLAHRSAEAAKNIKSLIEVTSHNVTQGVNVVSEAEKNMHDIVTGSGNVSRLMDEISASTSEQEKGISQITQALSELERVTQSNVSMVEELNGSSDVLRNQVIELQTRTRNFRLENEYVTDNALSSREWAVNS